MSAADVESLLERLADLDVKVTVHGDQLQLVGPTAAIGADLREQVRASKAELLRALGTAEGAYATRAARLTAHSPDLFTDKGTELAAVAPSRQPKPRRMPPIIESMPEPLPPRARRTAAPLPASPSKREAADLVKSLQKQGVRVSVKDGYVDLEGRLESLDQDLIMEVADREAEVLQELATPASPKRHVSLLDRIIGYGELR